MALHLMNPRRRGGKEVLLRIAPRSRAFSFC